MAYGMSAHRIGPGLSSVQPVMNLEPSWFTLTERGPSGGVEMISITSTWTWADLVDQHRGTGRVAAG